MGPIVGTGIFGNTQEDRIDPSVKVIARGSSRGQVPCVRRARSWACLEREFTSSASAVDEVTNLIEQRESLPAEGFRALVSLKDSESERDKR